jgi:hypothetical protein
VSVQHAIGSRACRARSRKSAGHRRARGWWVLTPDRMRAAAFAVAAIVTACGQPNAAGGPASCREGMWTAPVGLGGDSQPVLARFPSIALAKKTGMIAGIRVDLSGPISPRSDWLELRTLDGRRQPRPPGHFLFLYPKLVSGPGNAFSLFWAEPAGTSAPSDSAWDLMVSPAASVWAATYSPESGWSTPVRVYSGGIEWSVFFVDQVILDGSSLTVVAPKDLLRGGELVQLVLAAGHSRSREITGDAVIQPSVALVGGQLFVAFLAGAAVSGSDVNSVFVMASQDGGITWSKPSLVSRSGSQPANEVKLRVGPDESLHLVWKQSQTTGPHLLRHVVSRDSGRTWSAPNDLMAPDDATNLRAAVDSCGRLHVIFENARPIGSLDHAIWDGHWESSHRLFPDLHAADAALTANPAGGVTLVVNVGTAAGDSKSDRTYTMSWR